VSACGGRGPRSRVPHHRGLARSLYWPALPRATS